MKPHPWTAAHIQFLTQAELRALFRVITRRRDRAPFLVAYRHGLRASEVGLLQVDDVNLAQQRLTVRRVKRSLPGIYPLRADEVTAQHVPYAVLLYERYMGRPFASHRDSVSELVGDVMESAVEERLNRAQISFRRMRRGARVPDEVNAAVIIEAMISGDDGTTRDKLSRVKGLTQMRDERRRAGEPAFEVIACIDGRGFGVRRADMRDLLLITEGKVFTLATLDQLIPYTRLREFLPISPPEPQ